MSLARAPLVQGLLATLVAALLMVLLVGAAIASFVVVRTCSWAWSFPLFLLLLPLILGAGVIAQLWLAGRLGEKSSLFARRLFMAGCLMSGLLLGAFGSFVGPRFLDVFAAFGSDLPALTLLALMPGHFFWLLPFAMFVLLAVNAGRRLRGCWFGWAWAFEACLLVLVVGAMYMPIFKLGCVAS